jgi:heme exporter protein D
VDGFAEYLAMGGYARFVWPAWGLAVIVLGGLVVLSLRRLREREAELAALEAERPARPRRGGKAGEATRDA